MAFVKLVPETYPNKGDVFKLLNYICRYSKCNNELAGGMNVMSSIMVDPWFISDQFLAIQHGEIFQRRLYHVIISFDTELDGINHFGTKNMADMICDMYKDYQSVFVVHEDTKNPHAHIVFNNCPIFPDKPKLSSVINIMAIQKMIDTVVEERLGIR